MQIDLQIGGLCIRLECGASLPCVAWPLGPFNTFLRPFPQPPDLLVAVTVAEQLPDLPHGALRFDACHGLWKLFAGVDGSGFVFESADTQSLRPRTRALVSSDFSRAEAWVLRHRSRRGDGWVPMHLFNPLVEVCLVTLLARAGGLVLHAAGVSAWGGSRIFTGQSGAGKSTIADLFASRGMPVLSDERLIIRRTNGTLAAWGTPWVGASRWALNRTGPLAELYIISHGRERHRLEPTSPREVAPVLLQQCYLPLWDSEGMAGVLGVLDTLVASVPCWRLAFLKQHDLVEFLEEQSAGTLVQSA